MSYQPPKLPRMTEFQATPRELVLGLLVALGVLTVARDLLKFAERLRIAEELKRDPEGPARAAEEFLREESTDGNE